MKLIACESRIPFLTNTRVIPSRADGEGPRNCSSASSRREDAANANGVAGRKLIRTSSVRSLAVCAARDDSTYTREPRRHWGPSPEHFTGFRFGSIFARPVPVFTSMIIARERGAFELEVRGGALHLVFQFARSIPQNTPKFPLYTL
jgi:hypothetical protein